MTSEEVDALRALVLAQQHKLNHPIVDWVEDNQLKATFDRKTRTFTIAYVKTNEYVMRIRKNPGVPGEQKYTVTMRSRVGRPRSTTLDLAITLDRSDRYFALCTARYNNVFRTAISFETYDGSWFSPASFLFTSSDIIAQRSLFRPEALEIFQQLEQAAMAWGMLEVKLVGRTKLVAISEIKSAKY